MAIKVTSLQRKEATLAVDFDADTINLVYNSRGVNAAFEEQLTGEGPSIAKLAKALAGILISSDITEADGKTPWPLTAENLATLDGVLLDAILSQIMGHHRPNVPMPVN